MNQPDNFPIHNLNSQGLPIFVRDISHDNAYDFTRKHRHNYFEILFFEKGGGRQLVDFQECEVKDFSCYLVQPNQIQLLNRAPESRGQLIQFGAESVLSENLRIKLSDRIWSGAGAVLFVNEQAQFDTGLTLLNKFDLSADAERNLHLLQVLLFDLLKDAAVSNESLAVDPVLSHFLRMVDAHFSEHHSVQHYVQLLDVSDKKLATVTAKYLGHSPLQAIHVRLILEIKRKLMFGQESHKEIAYSLGFDSPASFSAFVKKKTGQTPSELQRTVE